MTATALISMAFALGMKRDQVLHEKWISISHKLGPFAGTIHTHSLQRVGRLDMLLRTLEGERLQILKAEPSQEPDWPLELQFALSENWLFAAYEVARAAKIPFQKSDRDAARLVALERRLALVRMPLAKGVIQGMHKKQNQTNPPILMKAGDAQPERYKDDGSYMMPHGLCGDTGAAIWSPVDIEIGQSVAICRRDLSDELLALFD